MEEALIDQDTFVLSLIPIIPDIRLNIVTHPSISELARADFMSDDPTLRNHQTQKVNIKCDTISAEWSPITDFNTDRQPTPLQIVDLDSLSFSSETEARLLDQIEQSPPSSRLPENELSVRSALITHAHALLYRLAPRFFFSQLLHPTPIPQLLTSDDFQLLLDDVSIEDHQRNSNGRFIPSCVIQQYLSNIPTLYTTNSCTIIARSGITEGDAVHITRTWPHPFLQHHQLVLEHYYFLTFEDVRDPPIYVVANSSNANDDTDADNTTFTQDFPSDEFQIILATDNFRPLVDCTTIPQISRSL